MATMEAVRIGIAGATGYAGQELLRLAARHPCARVTAAMGSAAQSAPRVLPRLARQWSGAVTPLSVETLAREADAAFLALPDADSAELAPELLATGVRVFDLSGAFRLRDADLRRRWYPHTPEAEAIEAVYGAPERDRTRLPSARLIACPGCYPTAAVLALHPLVSADLLAGDIVIDAKSGVSGAGKKPTERTHFSECHGNLAAYAIFAHRHAVEIEQELGVPVTFVPHLVPIDRGILETIYSRLRPGATEDDVAAAYEDAYAHAPFVRLTGAALPEIKHVAHTNFCDIGWRVDATTGRIVIVACIDNLVKGAAGQAIQSFNIAFGFDECAGLA
ncbi:MAG: N-acetyl-gamma-glutamyl-phosphate reductase [Acidobacteria bacterium]|nr:N-acetyl-gamma-glutamyl-phosphate reductase [Acidobacteriota bacterium]